jgi:aspartate carbamoyltransferase catalytic subunit
MVTSGGFPLKRVPYFLSLVQVQPSWCQAVWDLAATYEAQVRQGMWPLKVWAGVPPKVAFLFSEPSTRTYQSFYVAAHHLGLHVLQVAQEQSSQVKGEGVLDTILNLEAMGVGLFVLRHQKTGLPERLAPQVGGGTVLLNAGDGQNQHPSQALLDGLVIMRTVQKPWSALRIAIVGDLKHSRVVRSQVALFQALGVGSLHLLAPKALQLETIPEGVLQTEQPEEALQGVDVVMRLRLQKERLTGDLVQQERLSRAYCLTPALLAQYCPLAAVLHPGPVNWGEDLSDDLRQDPRLKVYQQVYWGVFVRMALLALAAEQGALADPGKKEW